eukprot:m.17911 g.17911  ORF g.17911 m.17911 type:complete len:92 (+) comp27565_c0_seq2:147-422(+)
MQSWKQDVGLESITEWNCSKALIAMFVALTDFSDRADSVTFLMDSGTTITIHVQTSQMTSAQMLLSVRCLRTRQMAQDLTAELQTPPLGTQ